MSEYISDDHISTLYGQIDELEEQRDQLAEDRRELMQALEWYANKDTWRNKRCDELNAKGGFFPYGIEECPIATDNGDRARTTLDKIKAREAGDEA